MALGPTFDAEVKGLNAEESGWLSKYACLCCYHHYAIHVTVSLLTITWHMSSSAGLHAGFAMILQLDWPPDSQQSLPYSSVSLTTHPLVQALDLSESLTALMQNLQTSGWTPDP